MADIPPLPPGATLVHPGDDVPPLPPDATMVSPGSGVPAAEPKRGLNLDLGAEALGNLVPSIGKQIGEVVGGIKNAVTHPIDTATTLGKLALTSMPHTEPLLHLAVTALAPHLDADQKKKLAGALGDLYGPKEALFNDYAEAYGDKDKFLKTIATDPARVLSDLATIATGGEAALARLPGVAGRVGTTGARVAQNLDPITAMTSVSGAGVRAIPHVLDAATNVGEGPMRQAFRSGVEGGQSGIDFRRAITGGVPPEELVDMARQGVGTMRQQMHAGYQAGKAQWAGPNQPQLGFNEITSAQQRAIDQIASGQGNTLRFKVNNSDLRRINTLFDVIEQWRRDRASWTIEGLDDLKQRLRNEVDWRADKPSMHRAAQTIIEGVRRQLLQNAPPAYQQTMRAYTDASRELENIERSFSLGRNASAETSLRKLQSIMRNNANTNYGMRRNLGERLADAGGVDIMPTIAGSALSSWAPRGIARGVISGGIPATAAMMAGHGVMSPATAVAGAAGLALTSPRMMGNTMYGAGVAARPLSRAWDHLTPTGRAILSSAVSQPARNAYGAFDRDEARADGGYFSGRR